MKMSIIKAIARELEEFDKHGWIRGSHADYMLDPIVDAIEAAQKAVERDPVCPLCDGWGSHTEESNCRVCQGSGVAITPFVKIGWADGTVATWIITQEKAEALDESLPPSDEIHMGGLSAS